MAPERDEVCRVCFLCRIHDEQVNVCVFFLNVLLDVQGVHQILCFFSKCCNFSELGQFCCSAGVLPVWCVYTHGHQGKTEKGQSPEYSKIFWNKYLMNTLCIVHCMQIIRKQSIAFSIRKNLAYLQIFMQIWNYFINWKQDYFKI